MGEFLKRNVVYIAGVVVVVVVVTAFILIAGSALSGCSPSEPETKEPAYSSRYDWSNLDRTDGRYRYMVNGEVRSRLGVDVSENQHDIDWDAVAADGSM